MFDRWGELVYRARFTVIAVMVAGLLGLAGYGLGLEDHLSQSGWDDPGSQSSQAARIADSTFGRDTNGDVLALYTAPEGKTVDDPEFAAAVKNSLSTLVAEHPDEILRINGAYWATGSAPALPALSDESRQHGVASIAIAGANDTELTNNFRAVKDAFAIDGIDVQLAGLQPISGALNDTMANDIRRMEILAIPAVGVLLFFVFGGVVAAALPLITGGLTVVAANGIVRLITNFTEVNSFVAPVVSLIGLGLAIDYGLFMVSRFREELAEGYDTAAAVRRTVITAGRTVVFSATMVITSLGGLLLFPQGFLKSVAYGAIATVSLAALTSVTVLPAILGILGKRIDKFGMKRFGQIQSSEQIEESFIGRLTRWVMLNPLKVTIPTVIGLLLLITPLTGIKFGGINETYLPPDHPTRVAQETFDELFPGQRAEPVRIVIRGAEGGDLNEIISTASAAPGLVERFSIEGPAKDGVRVIKAGLVDRNGAAETIDYLHSASWPDGVEVLIGGTPAIEQDSITALLDTLPLMVLFVVVLTTLLMFLAFGSLVLPIKAALMSALGLGSTLGILTWIFIDGHGASLMNFTPGPIMSPVLVLIIAIVYGLSTDYEVFLLSRMVEARSQGASTTESIRIGTAHTGRIITAAALILIVVTGAFGFSELVMMKYIAYGMIAALIIDATVIRMFLVPATMKLLGDDCWWAPAWLKRIQEKIGLAEPILTDELMPEDVPELITVGMFGPATVAATGAHRFPPQSAAGATDLTQPLPKIAAPRPASEQRRARDFPPAPRRVQGRAPGARTPVARRDGPPLPTRHDNLPRHDSITRHDSVPMSRPAGTAAGPHRTADSVPLPRRADGTVAPGAVGQGSPVPAPVPPPAPHEPVPREAAPHGLPPAGQSPPPPTPQRPQLPRRQRGEVPPPLPQTFVRPRAGEDPAAVPQPPAGGTAPRRAPDTQAIESWLSQLRRTSPATGQAPAVRREAPDEQHRAASPQRETPHRETPHRETPHRETLDRETLDRAMPHRRIPEAETPHRETPEPETPEPETPEPETPDREAPDRETPERGAPEHGRRRSDTQGGRHGSDSEQAISVSELIARQRRS